MPFSPSTFPTAPATTKRSISFTKQYEADRKNTSIKKFNRKLHTHFHYVLKQKRRVADYGVKRIRAILVESIEDRWTNELRLRARHPIVAGKKPSPLFWFTTSDVIFGKKMTVKVNGAKK